MEVRRGTPDLVRLTVGLLARCVTITQTCAHLAELGRRGELMVCVRTLYEHTVMLTWLLGDDGEQRMLLWLRYCDEQTLKTELAGFDFDGTGLLVARARCGRSEVMRHLLGALAQWGWHGVAWLAVMCAGGSLLLRLK